MLSLLYRPCQEFWFGRDLFGVALDDHAFCLEVSYAVVVSVSEHDGLFQHADQGLGAFFEPAIVGLVIVDDEAVGGVALWADERAVEEDGERSAGEWADGVCA